MIVFSLVFFFNACLYIHRIGVFAITCVKD